MSLSCIRGVTGLQRFCMRLRVKYTRYNCIQRFGKFTEITELILNNIQLRIVLLCLSVLHSRLTISWMYVNSFQQCLYDFIRYGFQWWHCILLYKHVSVYNVLFGLVKFGCNFLCMLVRVALFPQFHYKKGSYEIRRCINFLLAVLK